MKWLLCCLFLIAGCAPVIDRHWQELPRAEVLLSQLNAHAGRYNSLDAVAAVSLNGKGKYFPSQQFVLLERPDRLRADVLTGFGQLVLQLASDGRDMAVFLNNTVPGRYYSGPATDENISRFVRIPLKTEDLLALLLYDPPIIEFQRQSTSLVAGQLKLTLSGLSSRQELFFNPRLDLVGSHYYVQEKQALKVTYDKITDQDGFPRRVKIELPEEDIRVTLNYSEIQLNPQLSADQFTLDMPKNSIIELLPE